MEAQVIDIREVQTPLEVTHLGSGVSLVEDDGIEYIVDPGGCSCGGGRRVDTCEHLEAAQSADVGACGVDRGALAHQYLALDEALQRLVEAREALAAGAQGVLSEAVHELVERVAEEAELAWDELWGGSLDLGKNTEREER